ncbi:MAG: hypothetical protein GEU91_06210 [Rhizobiales bacterium]|nr:hypothetical protein [Hyphomicrobiales bacterium]
MLNWAIAVCIGLLVVVPAAAQTSAPEPPSGAAPAMPPTAAAPVTPPPAESDDPRFSFHRVQDGYLRLDSRTGQVALCSRRQVGWACQVLPDDRIVLESEIARLQTENGTLKKELLSRGITLPSGVSAPPSAAKTDNAPKSPDSSFNRVMTLVETMWHRLVEMIGNLQRDVMRKS